ncbi:hypothetical protein ABTZ78_17210 [Streptomyces bauhiniae]|uniref:hypothetical protein n=1 Tax=Streptomyces bauhiniae TaxID=2340725 RepID=UPI00332FE32F
MFFLAALVAAALACGTCTAWYVHRDHGLALALTAGAAVTAALPMTLLLTLAAIPGLGYVLAALAALAALRAYDEGRVLTGTCWAAIVATALACAHWGRG